MKTFKDLTFRPHPNALGGIQARLDLDNSFGVYESLNQGQVFLGAGLKSNQRRVLERTAGVIHHDTQKILAHPDLIRGGINPFQFGQVGDEPVGFASRIFNFNSVFICAQT